MANQMEHAPDRRNLQHFFRWVHKNMDERFRNGQTGHCPKQSEKSSRRSKKQSDYNNTVKRNQPASNQYI